MSYPNEDEYYGPSEFDEQVETFKEELRAAVKDEIRAKMDKLTAENKTMRAQLTNLDALEQAAKRAKVEADHAKASAERTARYEVQRKSAKAVADLLNKPKFCVEAESVIGPKCEHCDKDRYRSYMTPLGKKERELCDCGTYTTNYRVVEFSVHSASKRSGAWMAWYKIIPMDRRNDDDYYYESSKFLKNPDGVPVVEIVSDYTDYGFNTRAAAQAIADALNATAVGVDVKAW